MRFAATLTCVLALGTAGCTGGATQAADGRATVTHVVDGDTIDVEIGGRTERVRLIGIDTPETKKPNAPIECYGPEASAFTASLLPIGTDGAHRTRHRRPRRLRPSARLRPPRSTSTVNPTTFVNMEIVEQGFARPLTIEPNSTFARDFADAARRAERSDLGLWAACSS